MQWIKFMYRQFMREPLWFKVFISVTLLTSIIFSSSNFSTGYYHSIAKLATAIFFCIFGIKMRRNIKVSALFFVAAVICVYLSWNSLSTALN